MTTISWQDIALQKQDHRDKSIAKVTPPIPDIPDQLPRDVTGVPKNLLDGREVNITERSTEALVSALARGELTSVEVTRAFLRRAAIAQKLVNCVTELLPERALSRAEELDRYFSTHKKPVGPLHGLPISVKDNMCMKGLACDCGFAAWANRIADEDAYILKILWSAGCVFYARTTLPQLIVCGSSGGEGALIGLRGSCLGIGSDIGGSIRVPAAHNGLYGLRPTSLRLPLLGGWAPNIGVDYIAASIGPLSTSLEGLELFMKTALAAKPWLADSSLVAMPWNDDAWNFRAKDGLPGLKIGVMWDDQVVRAHPPVTRALREVVSQLESIEGVEVVNFEPYKHNIAWEIAATELIDSTSEPWRPLSRWIVTDNPYVKHRTSEELRELAHRRDEYRLEYLEKWNSTAISRKANGQPEGAIDVLLCPSGPGAALPLDKSRYWAYTSQWNVLDYPSVVFPVTKAMPEVDVFENDYQPWNEQDRYILDLYKDPEVYRDLPISLQLVGRRFEDEKFCN
ncbi:MAG: hypothetical protein Q9191_000624 [Dirinaria sp. TL-2023a]